MSGCFSFLCELFAPNKISLFYCFPHPELFLSKGREGKGREGGGRGMKLSFFDLSTQFPTLVRDHLEAHPNKMIFCYKKN
jgi:hypothetical protein